VLPITPGTRIFNADDSVPRSCGHSTAKASFVAASIPRSGRRGTRTPKRTMPPPVFKTGSSSGRMPSVCKLRWQESNLRHDGSEPPARTSTGPTASVVQDTLVTKRVGEKDLNLHFLTSKPGGLPLADPRIHDSRILQECPVGIEPTSPGWKPGTSAARPRAREGGKGGSRTLKASWVQRRFWRCRLQYAISVPCQFARCLEDARPLSRRLPLPVGLYFRKAAAAGIEPASGRLTAAYPYQHGTHRITSVRTVGFEPTISCFRSRRNGQAFPRPDSRAPSGSRTGHHPKDGPSAMARRQAAATSWALGWKPNCQRPKSTGRDSNPRRRITKAVSSPLDHRCLFSKWDRRASNPHRPV
jgi:hypothetical protein